MAITLDDNSRTNWDIFYVSRFSSFFWFVALWWIDSLSGTGDTVTRGDLTDFTFFFTRWTFFSSVFIVSDHTVTNGWTGSGWVGTGDTGSVSTTGITLNGTRRTLGTVEVFTVFTITFWWVDSSLGTGDTVVSGIFTGGTFSGTRWTVDGVVFIVTNWTSTVWGDFSVTSTNGTVGVGGVTFGTLDSTDNTGWRETIHITDTVSGRRTHFSVS